VDRRFVQIWRFASSVENSDATYSVVKFKEGLFVGSGGSLDLLAVVEEMAIITTLVETRVGGSGREQRIGLDREFI
jgi:hypothetical protein